MLYDVAIIGAGPAGLTAAIYSGRYLLNTLVIGKLPGGQISEAYKVCNFPSYISITGIKLTKKIMGQVKNLGIEIKQEEVTQIKKNKAFTIKTGDSIYEAKKVILAMGTEKRKLNVKGEDKFLGKGLSYCATCDAAFFKNKTVAVIGGSNAALTAAILLSEYANKVYVIYRKERFSRAEPVWIRQIEKNKKIETIFNSTLKEIYGKEKVEGIKFNGRDLKVDGIFVEIGSIPDEKFSKQLGLRTEEGYIIINKKQETSTKGVYAAGDTTNNPLKQAITAAAEGAIAANSVYEEIKKD